MAGVANDHFAWRLQGFYSQPRLILSVTEPEAEPTALRDGLPDQDEHQQVNPAVAAPPLTPVTGDEPGSASQCQESDVHLLANLVGSQSQNAYGDAGGTPNHDLPPCTNVMSRHCTALYKRITCLLADKTSEPYSTVVAWVRSRLSCALLRASVMCLRGSRTLRAPHWLQLSCLACCSWGSNPRSLIIYFCCSKCQVVCLLWFTCILGISHDFCNPSILPYTNAPHLAFILGPMDRVPTAEAVASAYSEAVHFSPDTFDVPSARWVKSLMLPVARWVKPLMLPVDRWVKRLSTYCIAVLGVVQ